jgi:hypothetical protein
MARNRRRPGFDRRHWETMTVAHGATTTGSTFITNKLPIKKPDDDIAEFFRTTNERYRYSLYNDTWYWATPNTHTGGAGVGAEMIYEVPVNVDIPGAFPPGVTFAITNSDFLSPTEIKISSDFQSDFENYGDCVGQYIQVTSGTYAGIKRKIINIRYELGFGGYHDAVVTIESPYPAVLGNVNIKVLTPASVLWQPTSSTTSVFRVFYSFGTQQTSSSITLPSGFTSYGTACKLITTPSAISGSYFTNNATSSATNTISDSSQSWYTNEWKNYQVRILSGTGEGQRRTITGNTTDTITVSQNWNIQPDTTSVYSLEACDDFIYLLGNNIAGIFRYQITTGAMTYWQNSEYQYNNTFISSWLPKTTEGLVSTNMHSMKHGNMLHVINFGSLQRTSSVSINEQLTPPVFVPLGRNLAAWAGSTIGCSADYDPDGDYIYVYLGPNSNNTFAVLDFSNPANGRIYPLNRDMLGQSTGVVGEKIRLVVFEDENGEKTKYIYSLHNSSSVLRRLLIS